MVRVPDDETIEHVARTCAQHGLEYMTELAPGQPPDLAQLEQALDPARQFTEQPAHRALEPGRNAPCPCGSGSGSKYKKCCVGKAPAPGC
ncbi:hypothetical protein FGE12_20295 [Aggregicoccus sp. 17bor-14]|nr:hypothetical protein [Aggregicoccus sp. 17bor-14]